MSNRANDLANRVLDGITKSIATCGLDRIPTRLAMGPIPAEDCCPDVVAWVSNLRPYDVAAPDVLQENRILNHFGLAFDLNIRVGLCYIESDDDGTHVNPEQLTSWTTTINRYLFAAYVGAIDALTDENDDTTFRPNPADPYNSGGCAGFTWTITLMII